LKEENSNRIEELREIINDETRSEEQKKQSQEEINELTSGKAG